MVFWKCQKARDAWLGRLHRTGSRPSERRLAPLSYLPFFFAISFPSKVLPSPAFRHIRKKANKALQSCATQVL